MKNKEKLFEVIISIFFIIAIISMLIIFLIGFSKGMEKSKNFVICKNVQKLYKDDILFDNFYISCNNKTFEIGKELYVRIVEYKDYKLTYNKNGSIYSIEKVEE